MGVSPQSRRKEAYKPLPYMSLTVKKTGLSCCSSCCTYTAFGIAILVLALLGEDVIPFSINVPLYLRDIVERERSDSLYLGKRAAEADRNMVDSQKERSVSYLEMEILYTLHNERQGENIAQSKYCEYIHEIEQEMMQLPGYLDHCYQMEDEEYCERPVSFINFLDPEYLSVTNVTATNTTRDNNTVISIGDSYYVWNSTAGEFQLQEGTGEGTGDTDDEDDEAVPWWEQLQEEYEIDTESSKAYNNSAVLEPDLGQTGIEGTLKQWVQFSDLYPQQFNPLWVTVDGDYGLISRKLYQQKGVLVFRTTVRMGLPLKGYQSVNDRKKEQEELMEQWVYSTYDPFFESKTTADLRVLVTDSKGAMSSLHATDTLFNDMILVCGAAAFVWIYLTIMTHSVYMSSISLLHILLSLGPSMLLYRYLFGVQYFGSLNMLTIFIIMGIGADDIFVFVDAWNQSKAQTQEIASNLHNRISYAFRRAAFAMLITSLTTMASFLANVTSLFPAISTFGLFSALVVGINYIAIITFYPTAVMYYHKHYAHKRGVYDVVVDWLWRMNNLTKDTWNRMDTDVDPGYSAEDESDEECSDGEGDHFVIDVVPTKPVLNPAESLRNSSVGSKSHAAAESSTKGSLETVGNGDVPPVNVRGANHLPSGDGIQSVEVDQLCSDTTDKHGVEKRSSSSVDDTSHASSSPNNQQLTSAVDIAPEQPGVHFTPTSEPSSRSSTVSATEPESGSHVEVMESSRSTESPISKAVQRRHQKTPQRKGGGLRVSKSFYRSGEKVGDMGRIELFFLLRFYPFIYKFRLFIVLLFIPTFLFFVIYGSMALAPDPDVPILLPDGDRYRDLDVLKEDHLTRFESLYNLRVNLVFGIGGIDRTGTNYADGSDRGVVLWDENAPDAITPGIQEWIIRLCDDIAVENDGRMVKPSRDDPVQCLMKSWKEYREDQNETFPIPTSEVGTAFMEFMGDDEEYPNAMGMPETNYDRWKPFVYGEVVDSSLNISDPTRYRLRIHMIEAQLDFRADDSFVDGIALGKVWEEWWKNEKKLDGFPDGLKGGFVESGAFHYFYVQDRIISEAYSGIGMSLGVAFVIICIATRNWIVSLLAVMNIAFIVSCVMSFIVFMGWRLGILEAIILVLVVGMSVDYVVHCTEAYITATRILTRHGKVRYMLTHVGVSVVSGALTTLGASTFMLFANITFITKFGTLIFFLVFTSMTSALFFLPPLLLLFGPTGKQGSVDVLWPFKRLWRLCRAGKGRMQTSETQVVPMRRVGGSVKEV